MMALETELGLSAAFTLISLALAVPDWLEEDPGPQITVNVMAGTPVIPEDQFCNRERYTEEQSFGGCAPDISFFGPNGDRVAYKRNQGCDRKGSGNRIEKGSPKDIMADFIGENNLEKPEYITVSPQGTDAMCISVVTVKPPSGELYAFLPGEMARVCKDYNSAYDWHYSFSEAQIQFKNPNTGTTSIDQQEVEGPKASIYQGFQVHLTDFKYDNSTFKAWNNEPKHMCDSLARFGGYKSMNVQMCPQVFIPPPKSGAPLPLKDTHACFPSANPTEDGKWYADACDDDRMSLQDRADVVRMYEYQCPREDEYWWYWDCPADNVEEYDKTKDVIPPILPPKPKRGEKNNYFKEYKTKSGLLPDDHRLQKQFAGKLVKSRDLGQSAVQLCRSKGSVGPNFYSEHEKMFCDMNKHKLYPACSYGGEMACFDSILNETRIEGMEKKNEKSTYLQVQDWI